MMVCKRLQSFRQSLCLKLFGQLETLPQSVRLGRLLKLFFSVSPVGSSCLCSDDFFSVVSVRSVGGTPTFLVGWVEFVLADDSYG